MIDANAPRMPAHEKRRVALTSLVAAAFLTATKVAVGVLSGSLGLLSEGAHSALDLLAAAITFVSVRAADLPADKSHPFGHGKVEQLSAFIQTGLLFITSAWIVVEAARRLFFQNVHVQPSVWAFAVLGASIIIDTGRSRALSRAARTYQSQALQADALHFSTDSYGSGAVTLGLVSIFAAQHGLPPWLRHADPVAGLVVAGITLYVGLRLGHETVGVLLDAAPEGVSEKIATAISRVPGVQRQDRIRVRQSGNRLFIDLRLILESNIALEHAESVVEAVEAQVRQLYPTADVVVDISPSHPPAEDLLEKIRSVANRENFQVHDVVALRVGSRINVELDLEVDPALSLEAAHEQATRLEDVLRREFSAIGNVNVHLEPRQKRIARGRRATRLQTNLEPALAEIVRTTPGVLDCHALDVHEAGRDVLVTVHCLLRPGLAVTQVHDITEALEQRLRGASPRITRVNIHPEPQSNAD